MHFKRFVKILKDCVSLFQFNIAGKKKSANLRIMYAIKTVGVEWI